jgi:ankyrin repeat protein
VKSITSPTDDPIKLFKKAFVEDDATTFGRLLEEYPAMKARINEPVGAFDSPIITQVRSRPMLDVLLAAGADINAKSRWWAGGFGILHGAEPDLARYAIERGAVVDVHAAARLGLMKELRALISSDASLVHARGGDGQTPLHFANSIQVAEYLLEQGADLDARDVDHESTPAQYMVRERQEVARFLVRRGCQTDLLMATALGDGELVLRHLEADPACIRMNVSEQFFPKQNKRSGGTIYIWTLGQNKTAHQIAQEFGHEKVLRLLLERSPEELKLGLACDLGDEALFKKLLARRPSLVQKLTEDDQRKLPNAAQANNAKTVGLMLEAGWPVAARGQHGGTALHWAAFHGNAAMAEAILRHNPSLELTDDDFHSTPLGWAIHGSEHGWNCRTGKYPATVQALLEAGARPPAKVEGTEEVRKLIAKWVRK